MSDEKNSQSVNAATRVLATTKNHKIKDQRSDFRRELIGSITQLHSEVDQLVLAADLRAWKIGKFLQALKTLSGHGNFQIEFESLLGDVFGYRQAGRYMAKARKIDQKMPVIRARIVLASPESDATELSDEEVLRTISPDELKAILSEANDDRVERLPSPTTATQSLHPAFIDALHDLFGKLDYVFVDETLELASTTVGECRISNSPITTIPKGFRKLVVIAGVHPQAPMKSVKALLEHTEKDHQSEMLLALPLQILPQFPSLFSVPELFLTSAAIFTKPLKKINSTFVVSFLSRHERGGDFQSAFKSLGTVKLPIH